MSLSGFTSGPVGASRDKASAASAATSMSSGIVFLPSSGSALDASPTSQHSSVCAECHTAVSDNPGKADEVFHRSRRVYVCRHSEPNIGVFASSGLQSIFYSSSTAVKHTFKKNLLCLLYSTDHQCSIIL